jgi:hypothetical protein
VDSPEAPKDTLKFPIQDRAADKFNEDPPSQFDLKDPKNIQTEVTYDPDSQQYDIKETDVCSRIIVTADSTGNIL